MKLFKDKWFSRFARQNDISDDDLGGGVIKQRIPRPGRSSGFRSIMLFRSGERAVFVFGFAKSDQDNISAADLKDFRGAARRR